MKFIATILTRMQEKLRNTSGNHYLWLRYRPTTRWHA